MIIVMVIGLLVGGIGALMLLRQKKLRNICTERVDGVVSDVVHDTSIRRDRTRTMTYAPTFSYTVDGREYVKMSSVKTSNMKLQKGDTVAIFYNPNNPNQYYVSEYRAESSMGYTLIIIGAIFIAAGIYAVITEI